MRNIIKKEGGGKPTFLLNGKERGWKTGELKMAGPERN